MKVRQAIEIAASRDSTERALPIGSNLSHGFDLRVERDKSLGDDPDIVTQALSHDVEVAARGNALLSNFLAKRGLDSRNCCRQPGIDVARMLADTSQTFPDSSEFLFDVRVHDRAGSNNPTIVIHGQSAYDSAIVSVRRRRNCNAHSTLHWLSSPQQNIS